MGFVAAMAALLAAFFYLRLRRIQRVHRQLTEAAERGRSVLLEEREGGLPGYHLQAVVRTFNHMVAENAKISDTGQSYLDQIQTTLGNLREAVVMVDGEGIVRLANPAFRELVDLGRSPLGRRLDTFIQGAGFQEFLLQVRQAGEGRRTELETLVGQNSAWLEISAAPLPDNPRTPGTFTLFVFHDITRQKELERMRTEFVANVSHELRTPVTIIKGFTDTLLEDGPELSPEEQAHFLGKIRANSERLSNLLQDLLLLSRLESTHSVLQRERISVSKLIREVISHWKGGLEDPAWELRLDLAEGNDVVYIDSLRFSQVLINLLENILRHAGQFREITIRTEILEDGVQVWVADDGSGIAAKELPHIFERFYRIDKARSRETGGTGLGLSIVKHIVQQHGGRIEAHSEPGQGTRIGVFFPFPERIAEQAVFKSLRRQISETHPSPEAPPPASSGSSLRADKEE